MKRIEKTVFLSYRRTNATWTLAIFQNLKHEGYDVFFDYSSIPSGDFESAILENIKARAHFLVLLTPSAMERCGESNDWLRREIETALDNQRNIVPLMLESFDFGTPSIASQLTGKLAALKAYNGLSVPVEYFEEAMTKLRQKFLNVPLDTVLHPASDFSQQAVKEQQTAAATALPVRQVDLTAQNWCERGFIATDTNEKLRCYNEAIRLNPDYVYAYVNRGVTHLAIDNVDHAIQDFSEAIRRNPERVEYWYLNRAYAYKEKGDWVRALQDMDEAIRRNPACPVDAYANRGNLLCLMGDWEGALRDYTEAIRLKPEDGDYYRKRGDARVMRSNSGDLEEALEDYTESISRKPNNGGITHNNRGIVRAKIGDVDGAIQDFNEAIRADPNNSKAYNNRGKALDAKGDTAGAQRDFETEARIRANNSTSE